MQRQLLRCLGLSLGKSMRTFRRVTPQSVAAAVIREMPMPDPEALLALEGETPTGCV
jgi:hypothetical protein